MRRASSSSSRCRALGPRFSPPPVRLVEGAAEAADGPGLLLADEEARGADEIGGRGGQGRGPAGGAGGPRRRGRHGGGAVRRRRHSRTARQGRGHFEGGRLRLGVLERLLVGRLHVHAGRRAEPCVADAGGVAGGCGAAGTCRISGTAPVAAFRSSAASAASAQELRRGGRAAWVSTASEGVIGMVPVRASESSPRRRSRRRRSSGCSASAAALAVLLSTGSGILVPPGTHSAGGCGARLNWSKLQF